MKKVININFSGRLINIEEDAYTSLQSYIESLKKYFSNEEGQEEIIADIENRIAEIFYEKQTKGATSITIVDVEEVMAAIGKPEDFEAQEEPNTKTDNHYQSANKQFINRGRLYRDANDKMLGGVCSGVAAYFNIDTVLVRVLFAVLLFGAGVGFLLYIILWVVIPESMDVQTSMEKRLYRNPDEKMIGGVASGLSKYFGIEVWIPRLIFAAPFIFAVIRGASAIAYHNFFNDNRFWTFGFGGTTTVVYFLLWWIIPEAKSVQEKMAMKGEKLDLNSIRNNVQDGIKNFSDKANAWGKDITNKSNEWTKNMNQRTQENVARVNTIARSTSNKIGHGIGLLIKGFALFIGGIIAFALLMGLLGILIGGAGLWPFKSFLLEGGSQTTLAWGSLLVLLIPGVSFLVWIGRRIFKIKKNIKPVKIVLAALFFIGIVSAIFLTGSLLRSFEYSNYSKPDSEIAITQPTDRLLVTVKEAEVSYSGELPWVHLNDNGFDINRDTLKYANVKIKIERSIDSLYHTSIKKYSRGNSTEDAEARAQKIVFQYSQIGNTLDLGSHIAVGKNEKFRAQEVVITIQVPEGRKIQFDETVDKLHPFNVRVNEVWENGRRKYRRRERVYFEQDYNFDYKVNEDYIMSKDGRLELVNKPKETPKEDDLQDKKEELEQKKNELKEKEMDLEKQKLDKQIQELEKQKQKLEDKKNSTFSSENTEELSLKNPVSLAYIHCLM
jgi:phage shock protein PspC (stress-responsive transcriptional regulator)